MLFSFAKAEEDVNFILFGGFNTSRLLTDFTDVKKTEVTISKAKQSYNYGAAFRFKLTRSVYLQPEVYLTRKGGLEKSLRVQSMDSFSQDVSAQSIDMPIMLGLYLFRGEKSAFRLYGGPVVSFLQDHDVDIQKNGEKLSEIDGKTNVFSVQIGTGFDIHRLTFDVRYEYAYSPMLTVSDFKTAYRILYFTIGFKLI